MSDQLPGPASDAPRSLRLAALIAVGAGVTALAAAAFVLSYSGLHSFAVQAGITARLAKGYPVIFDVLLVIILAAVLSLRSAGLPSRMLAWTCLLALLAAAAGADALHASGRKLPAQAAAMTAAVVPWVVVLIAFGLLLAMLRHARLHRAAITSGPQISAGLALLEPAFATADETAYLEGLVVAPHGAAQPDGARELAAVDVAASAEDSGSSSPPALLVAAQPDVPRQLPREAAADAAELSSPSGPDSDLAVDADPPLDDPATDAGPDEDAQMPVFHRMWSSPTPPDPE